jgi:hypothetical protein
VSTDRDVTRIVRSWLDEGVNALPDRVLDLVLDQIPSTPQRRSSWSAWRHPVMNNTIRIALAAAAVVAIVLLGYQLFVVRNVGGPAPSPSDSSAPTPTASPAVSFSDVLAGGTALEAGDYVIDYAAPVLVTFTVPDEPFESYPSPWQKALFDWGPWHQSNEATLAAVAVGNLFVDPCDRSAGVRDPGVGPSVADLVAALSEVPGLSVSEPADAVISGYSGQLVELTGEVAADCTEEPAIWVTTGGEPHLGLPAAGDPPVRVWILDVEGHRLVLVASEGAGFNEQQQLQDLIDTIVINVP